MQITINQILTNGMIDTLTQHPRLAGFVMGALDSGWMVSKRNAAFVAKMNKVTVMVNSQDDEVYFFLRSERLLTVPFDEFQWTDVSVSRGNLSYLDKFITKTSPDYGKA